MRLTTWSSLAFLLSTSSCADVKTAQDYLQEANSFLTSGKFNDALNSYSDAIDADPENYVTYYKRATTYMSLGRNQAALQDFTQILQLKPDFDKALFQRGKLYIKVGQVDDALEDLNKFLSFNSENDEAKELLESAEKFNQVLLSAKESLEKQDYQTAVDQYSECLRVSPQSLTVRRSRAEAHLKLDQIEEAVGDWTVITHLDPMDKSALLQLSKVNYFMLYQAEPALQNVKKYLHYDPEDKEFKVLFRTFKKYEKKISKLDEHVKKRVWTTVVDTLLGNEEEKGLYDEIVSTLDELKDSMNVSSFGPDKLRAKLYVMECQAHSRLRNKQQTIDVCTKAIESDSENTQILIARGDGYIALEDYENAIRDYTAAFEKTGSSDNKIYSKLQKAKQELKKSKQRDYYKILGVSREASSREIKKAYNKVARELHPDKYRGDLSEDQVLAKMAEVNQAYEVLKDEELRARFDRGDDPNDPHGGQNQNPFAHHGGGHQFFFNGGSPFGQGSPFGGGAHFKFNF